MKKYLINYAILTALFFNSCDSFKRDVKNDAGAETDLAFNAEINGDNYLSDIDEYVNYIKAHGENLQFIHNHEKNIKTVISVLDKDTVRISLIGDSLKEDIDIYYKDSEPLLLSRERILDVDSNFLETVYLKDSKIYKCFRDGVELKNKDSLKMYASMIKGLK
jgi:hypothetical protein